jgi:hypothetical protein
MKNRKMGLIFVILASISISISACHSNDSTINKQIDEDCGKQISKSLSYINNFYFEKNPIYLDSALLVLKGIENKSLRYKNVILNDEVHVYFLKKDFSAALSTLNSISDSIYPFPSFKKVLEFKIKAKEAEINKNEKKQKECFYALIIIFQRYLDDNQQAVESILRQADMNIIKQSPNIDFVLSEMFFYKTKIQTMNKTISEIESFRKMNSGNLFYFNELKRNIKRNDGQAIGILLY